jgi:multidrug resistance efflux pump
MEYVQPEQSEEPAIERLEEVQEFDGEPSRFWPACLEALAGVSGAVVGLLIVRAQEGPDGAVSWRRAAVWPSNEESRGMGRLLSAGCDPVLDEAAEAGRALNKVRDAQGHSWDVMAVRLKTGNAEELCIAAFLRSGGIDGSAAELLLRLQLLASIPSWYQLRRVLKQAQEDVQRFASVLDVMVVLNRETRFLSCALALCNELAARHQCERVSLGWLHHEKYIRLQAISRTERFERKMDAVKQMELAMEETLDQDEEIVLPADPGSPLIVRDHQEFSQAQGAPYICSLPMRTEGDPVAVLMLERASEPFDETDVRLFRLACDLAMPRLQDLKEKDRWFGARWLAAARRGLGKIVGVEHTFAKVIGLIVCLTLAFLIFWQVDFRVESPFRLKADRIAFVPAPFDGYINEVYCEIGDDVSPGDQLLALDVRDLLLEEAAAAADQTRYAREAEKARAQQQLADMRIALAQSEQARVRLERVRYRLEQASIHAPMHGVVAEGDLEERLGAPVKRGDILFRIAGLEDLYVQAEVPERDIHHVENGAAGEIAFASQPKLKFPMHVVKIEPVAQAGEEGSFFIVRCELDGSVEQWWRPGMEGVSKIEAGKRSVLWIFTRRTVDFLRMFFWW